MLGPNVTQTEIFDSVIKPLVDKVKQGFNCTALAYGQTGTGKSYTMGLDSEVLLRIWLLINIFNQRQSMFVFQNFDGDNAGVIPRCLREMFLTSEENSENLENSSKHVDISASFIEIYNEKVYDLLGNNTNEPIVAKGMCVLILLSKFIQDSDVVPKIPRQPVTVTCNLYCAK